MMEEKKSKPKKKKNGKIDKPTLIFFVLMIIGLIVLTIIILTKPTSKIYAKDYGQFVVAVEIYSNNKVDMAIDVEDNRVLQQGTYKEIKDDDIENNFKATFISDDETTGETVKTEVELVIKDDILTIVYDDGTEIELKEIDK